MAINCNAHLSSLASRIVFRQCCCRLYSAEVKAEVSEERDLSEIVIPRRIQRGPTDILKALQSTLKKDYTAPKYKYADDPYMIPISNITKRAFALSKESGKKAARYFLESYPQFFKCHKSVPFIKAFEPPVQYTEDEVTEEILLNCIESFDVANCITVHQLLTKKGISFKPETQQKLLEILCFYNSTVPIRDDFYEERWYARKANIVKNEWLTNGLAERLFQEMEKDSSSYCAMIQGAAKYGCHERAFQLFDEMQEKNLPVTLETYNSLLIMVPRIKESGDLRWEYAMDLVKNMNFGGLKPNLYTMNALLNIVAMSSRWNKGKSIALQTLAEMKRLNIEPSLGSYYYLLVIFCITARGFSTVLSQIMNKLDGKEPEIRHPDDLLFFHTAMEACYKVELDKDLAYRLNAFLESGTNYKFIASAFHESIYFQYFVKLLCSTEDFDKFMVFYEKYVPSVYTPDPRVMFDILMALDLNGSYKHLTKICSDLILFEQTEREDILAELLRISGSTKLESQDQELLIRLIWGIIEKIDVRAEKRMQKVVQWTGLMFGDVLQMLMNGNDLEKSWIIMQRLKDEEFAIVGLPGTECLTTFCKLCLEAKEFRKVEYCVNYAMNTINFDMKPKVTSFMLDLVEKKLWTEKDREIMNKLLEVEKTDVVDIKNTAEQKLGETLAHEETKDVSIKNSLKQKLSERIAFEETTDDVDIKNSECKDTIITPDGDKS